MSERERDTTPVTIKFHYIKSAHFKVAHVDGAFGGITPRGYIHMAVYNERQALPQVMEQDFTEDGSSTTPRIVSAKEGVVREVEFDLIMDLRTAREMHDWLGSKVKQLEDIIGDEGKL